MGRRGNGRQERFLGWGNAESRLTLKTEYEFSSSFLITELDSLGVRLQVGSGTSCWYKNPFLG